MISTLKKITTRKTSSSSAMNQRPRVSSNVDNFADRLSAHPLEVRPVPARKTKIGAQKCVIQRVKNRIGYVRVTSVGSNTNASRWTKSRV